MTKKNNYKVCNKSAISMTFTICKQIHLPEVMLYVRAAAAVSTSEHVPDRSFRTVFTVASSCMVTVCISGVQTCRKYLHDCSYLVLQSTDM